MTFDEVRERYGVSAGHFLIVRDKVETAGRGEYVASTVIDDDGKEIKILGTQERADVAQMVEPWATVLMVGPKYHESDYCPPVVEGQRVFISAIGGKDIRLGDGGDAMDLTLIPHVGVLFWDKVMPE